MVNLINLKQQRLDDIVTNQLEVRIRSQFLNILTTTGHEIIDTDNIISVREQSPAKVRTDKTGPTSEKYAHAATLWPLPPGRLPRR